MDDDFWVAESSGKPLVCQKRKRRVVKRKFEFIGWGSKQLIEFLEAIGQDTSKKHSRYDVATFITKYINDKGLSSAKKKKKVLCDERLYDLFLKKTIFRTKIYDMLEEHFAENHDNSDDELLDSSEEEDYGKKRSFAAGQMKKAPKTPKSCFAAVICENIKLVYLKRSLIQELLKFPESFEFKITGSFVRVKSDPNDIYQKNRFQLQQVTGVEKISGDGDASTDVCLRVTNFFKDVSICMLSDDNFAEEELEDLRDRIKAGSHKRLTVNELESKAQILHVDITKHWIAKEISLLQKLIDRANEKGWRRELFEYLERRKLLQTPSEQEKLLHKIPEVIAEELEPEGTVADASEKAEGSGSSPKSILRGNSDVSSTDASGSGDLVAPSQVIFSDLHAPEVQNEGADGVVPVSDPIDDEPAVNTTQRETQIPDFIGDGSRRVTQVVLPQAKPKQVVDIINLDIIDGSSRVAQVVLPQAKTKQVVDINLDFGDGSSRVTQVVLRQAKPKQVVDINLEEPEQVVDTNLEEPKHVVDTNQIIDLSDYESEDEDPKDTGECPGDVIWHYADPQGQTQGPFSLYSLKRWSDANYFHSAFRVWKSGQNSDEPVLLVDVLRQTFPHCYN